MKDVLVVENFFEQNVIDALIEEMHSNPEENLRYDLGGHSALGRTPYHIERDDVQSMINSDLQTLIRKKIDIRKDLSLKNMTSVEYSSDYGEPNLPPHFDRDDTEVIINLQILSNTTWGVGVDEEVFYIEDNTAVIFNPNTHIHWRPIKKFGPGEFVQMIFFRFGDDKLDNSRLPNHPDDEIFAKIHEIRNNLK